MIKTRTHWNEETGYALVVLYDTKKDKTFVGVAQCHEDDMDMKSSLTGLSIAQYRAEIEMYKYYKELLTIELNALLDFEKSAKCCKYYNENFQVENLLHKRIEKYRLSLIYVTNMIKVVQENLQNYLRAKAELYQKLRDNRKKKKGENQ